MIHSTYADLFRPQSRSLSLLHDILLVTGFSLLLGLSAQLSVPLPFSPVPVTAQTLAILLTGALLGGLRGMACVMLYLLEGAAGLPFFSGGRSGLIHLFGPTGGYLFGFPAASLLVGLLAEQGWDRRIFSAFLAMLFGNAVIYLFGLSWLGLHTGYDKVLSLGLYPFIPGDLCKIAIAVTCLPLGWKALKISAPPVNPFSI